MQILSIRYAKELTEEPSALGGLGTSIPRKWKEECMNHGRGERTDHLPIFDPTKKTMPEEQDIKIDRYKSHLHQSIYAH